MTTTNTEKRNCNPVILKTLDYVISLTWICHLVVAVWRGTWNLLDLYVLPGDLISGTWISYFGGIILYTATRSAYPILHRNIPSDQRVTRFVISHVMLYIAMWGTIGQWRGIWYILDRYMDIHWRSNSVTLAVSLTLLWFFKSSIRMVGPPFAVGYDLHDDIFVCVPRLKTNPSRYWDYIIDHFLSGLVLETLVTSAWRSLWNIFNDVILPQHYLYSNLITWSSGLAVSLTLLVLEKPVSFCSVKSRKCGFGCKLLVENIYTLLCFVSTVAVWRGWWNILEGILLKGMLFGGLICHCVGVVLLLCTCATSSLISSSYIVDGEAKSGIHWNIEYLQLIFKHRLKAVNTEDYRREKNNNDQDNLLKETKNGNYIKCSPDFELEDLQLTSI